MEWLAKTAHLAMTDEGEVYLLDLASEDPDHAHLGGINEGRAYRRCPREYTAEWWTLEDAWAAECEDRPPAREMEDEAESTYQRQHLGGTV